MTQSQVQEYIKCVKDKDRIYFIENYLSTFNADERKEVPFKLFPRQKVYLKTLATHDNIVTVKHRQCGISTVTSAWATAQMLFAKKESPETILCIANKKDMSQSLLRKITEFIDQIPRWMWGDEYYSPDPDSPKNTKSIYVKRNSEYIELFNGCTAHARSSGPNASRGISAVSILILDEAAFIADGVSVYTSARAAQASVTGAKVVLISTPNGKDPLYWKTYDNAVNKRNNFESVEFKWYQDLRYNKYLEWHRKNDETGEEEVIHETIIGKKGEVEYNEERWKKLEKEGWKPQSPWYKNMCLSFNNDTQKIAQELDISFLGSSDTVVPVDVIEEQTTANVIDITEDWPLRDVLVQETYIWKDPIPGHRYICSCLPEGEKVMTEKGLKNVEDITFSDRLVNKEGKVVGVKQIYKRNVKEEEIYSIKLSNVFKPIVFTGEHPLYVDNEPTLKRCWSKFNSKYNKGEYHWDFDFKFIKAKDVKCGAWTRVPNVYYDKELESEEILSKWDDMHSPNPLLDEDFWWYCGIWLAEGCCVKSKWRKTRRIYTSHNTNEISIMNRVKRIAKDLLGVKNVTTTDSKKNNATNVSFVHNYFARWLNKNFGRRSYGKHIAEWIKCLPDNLKKELINGYIEGDGTITVLKRDGKIIKMNSVSYKLLEDIQDMLFSMGFVSSLSLNSSKKFTIIEGRTVNCRKSYELSMGHHETQVYLGEKCNRLRKRSDNCFLSDDNKFIYFKIKKIEKTLYNGSVYNFETDTHTYCCRNITVHNCDASSGSGEDATAIEVIDVDAIDENGVPFFEQVLEYNGKLNGSDVGQLVYRYGTVYNNALAVVECIGGYGDAIILTLQELGYPNLYYDDTNLKNYTNETIKAKNNTYNTQKQLPGFRSNALRLQMISNFIELLKSNLFRVRSRRVISELGTWIFKNGRPDHMDGMHDDLLTCLAMGLFVMQFYMLKADKDKQKDAAIAASWYVNNQHTLNMRTVQNEVSNKNFDFAPPNYKMNPFVNNKKNHEKSHMKGCILLGGYKC